MFHDKIMCVNISTLRPAVTHDRKEIRPGIDHVQVDAENIHSPRWMVISEHLLGFEEAGGRCEGSEFETVDMLHLVKSF